MIVSHLLKRSRGGEDANSLFCDLHLVQTTFPLLLPDRNLLRLFRGSSSAKGVETLCWSRTDHGLAKFLRVPEAVISWEENRSRGCERFRAAPWTGQRLALEDFGSVGCEAVIEPKMPLPGAIRVDTAYVQAYVIPKIMTRPPHGLDRIQCPSHR